MKDGRTHLAHKAEHAVDVDSGAVVSARLDGADVGDTTTVIDTVVDAPEQPGTRRRPAPARERIPTRDPSSRTLLDLHALDVRPSAPTSPNWPRGRRQWRDVPEAQALVYANRRLRGARVGRLRRHRAAYVERSFAHLYETGGMRRTHLRGHQHSLKRLLVHPDAFNLGPILRQLTGRGTPRGFRGRCGALRA